MSEYADGFDNGKGAVFDELMVEITTLRLDAERYRWLRQRIEARHVKAVSGHSRLALQTSIGLEFFDSVPAPRHAERYEKNAQKLDAAIDAAKEEEK